MIKTPPPPLLSISLLLVGGSVKHILINLGIAIIAALAPVKSMVLTTLILIVLDLITGVLAARKKKKTVTSRGMRRTLIKFVIYEVAIISAFLTQTYLTGELIPVCNIVTGFIGLTEITSIIENLNILGDNKLLTQIVEKLENVNGNESKK